MTKVTDSKLARVTQQTHEYSIVWLINVCFSSVGTALTILISVTTVAALLVMLLCFCLWKCFLHKEGECSRLLSTWFKEGEKELHQIQVCRWAISTISPPTLPTSSARIKVMMHHVSLKTRAVLVVTHIFFPVPPNEQQRLVRGPWMIF